MGVSIYNKYSSIDMGYDGFRELRKKIAHLYSKELGQFYDELDYGIWLLGETRKDFFKNYDERLSQIDEELGIDPCIIDFLYASDCSATMSAKHCRRLWNVIKNYDDDIVYGYSGRSDAATFKDFKKIVKECRDKNIQMHWD